MTLSLDGSATERGAVTLVTAVVRNDGATDRRVRVTNALDGAVLAPRPGGVVADGWDDGGYEGVVAAGGTLALGYACRAAARAEPCRIERSERVGEDEGDAARALTVADAVRELGDPRPPAAGVPEPEAGRGRVQRADGRADERDAVPSAVAAWLNDVATRAEDGATTRADERALAAVRERVDALAGGATAGDGRAR